MGVGIGMMEAMVKTARTGKIFKMDKMIKTTGIKSTRTTKIAWILVKTGHHRSIFQHPKHRWEILF
jgi:hypothetical protein